MSCRDPDDLPVLGTAVAGGASVLVTGDEDLLTLHEFQGIVILSPREFHDRCLT
jgi:predicted nucleic acid-binding protein